jgi:hypothetical protein
MTIDAIRRQTPEEFRAAVDGFDTRYVGDWDAWLTVEPALLMTSREWSRSALRSGSAHVAFWLIIAPNGLAQFVTCRQSHEP